jgi:hypothetical protein
MNSPESTVTGLVITNAVVAGNASEFMPNRQRTQRTLRAEKFPDVGVRAVDGPIGTNSRSRRYFRIADDTPKRRFWPVRTRRCAVTPAGTFPCIIRT